MPESEYMATLLLGKERTPATRITGYFENLSDSKFKVVQLAKMRSKRSLPKILYPLCFNFKCNHSIVFFSLKIRISSQNFEFSVRKV